MLGLPIDRNIMFPRHPMILHSRMAIMVHRRHDRRHRQGDAKGDKQCQNPAHATKIGGALPLGNRVSPSDKGPCTACRSS